VEATLTSGLQRYNTYKFIVGVILFVETINKNGPFINELECPSYFEEYHKKKLLSGALSFGTVRLIVDRKQTKKTGPEAGQYFHVRPPIDFI